MARTSFRGTAAALLLGACAFSASGSAQTAAPADLQAAFEAGEQRRRAAEAQHDETQQRAGEARRKAAEARRKADVARRDAEQLRRDEADMLARARAEAEEHAAERRMREAEVERADAERAAVAARNARDALLQLQTPAEREAAAERLIEAAKAADAARRAMEEERAEEVARLAEKLRQAQERRAAAGRALNPALIPPPEPSPLLPPHGSDMPVPTPITAPPLPSPLPASPAHVAEPSPAPVTRLSVLLVMAPGDRGIRRVNKTADPVLCLDDACYISRGPDRDARRMSRREALGLVNTLGGRAGACREQLSCVFRNVDLGGARARLQPIDLRLVRHDRREAREIGADASCGVAAGRLSCAGGVTAPDYRLWLVPERIAEAAGPRALESAVRDGLQDGRRAELRR